MFTQTLTICIDKQFFHHCRFPFSLTFPSTAKMLDIMEFAIDFQWTALKTELTYRIIRLRYENHASLLFTLVNGELLILDHGNPQWCEFVLKIHCCNFNIPRSHGLRGMIKFIQLKKHLSLAFAEHQTLHVSNSDKTYSVTCSYHINVKYLLIRFAQFSISSKFRCFPLNRTKTGFSRRSYVFFHDSFCFLRTFLLPLATFVTGLPICLLAIYLYVF